MNKFTYNILFISNNTSDKIIKKIHKKTIIVHNTEFTVNVKYNSFNIQYLKKHFPHAVVFDCFNKYYIDEIIKMDNQIEIFVIDKKIKTYKFNNVFFTKKEKFNAEYIIKKFYSRRYRVFMTKILNDNLRDNTCRFASPAHIRPQYLKKFSIQSKLFYNKYLFQNDISVSDIFMKSSSFYDKVLKNIQNMISKTYNCKNSFICVQGSSTSNKIVILSLLKQGDKVLVDRNVHRSIIYSIILSGAIPVFFNTNFDSKFDILLPPKIDDIKQKIQKHKNAKLIILTYPTYEGINRDLSCVIKFAHKWSIKVFIDQAWGSHLHFHSDFYPDAIMSGADYVVLSFHKTLMALSMSSVILINDPNFEKLKNNFIENINMFSTTSPLYPLIESIDETRRIMSISGRNILYHIRGIYDKLSKEINKSFILLDKNYLAHYFNESEKVGLDYSKLTASYYNYLISKDKLREIFKKHNIIVEKINNRSFTLLIHPGIGKKEIDSMCKAIKIISKTKKNRANKIEFAFNDFNMNMIPRDAYFNRGEWVHINRSLNRVSSNLIVPYPPGVPLVIPGQIIDKNTLEQLINANRIKNMKIYGIVNNKIKVVN